MSRLFSKGWLPEAQRLTGLSSPNIWSYVRMGAPKEPFAFWFWHRNNRLEAMDYKALRGDRAREWDRAYRKRPDVKAKKRISEKKYRARVGSYLPSAAVYQRKKYHSDPNYRIGKCLRARLRNSLSFQKITKRNKTVKLLGCSIDCLRHHLEAKFERGMTWNNHGTEWHIDHIQPLDSFNLSEEYQLKLACHYTNLQPLWARQNLIKNKTVPANQQLQIMI